MLEDVLDAALAVPGWETWVVTPDEAALEVAARRGARPVAEDKPPLASAVRQVEELAASLGAEAVAVLLADTPLVTTSALTAALRTLGPVVLAPDRDRFGTNLLLRRPPRAIRARFGAESFRKHLEAAALAGLPAATIESPELSFDLDAPDDILTVLRSRKAGRTRAVCLDLRERIGAHTR